MRVRKYQNGGIAIPDASGITAINSRFGTGGARPNPQSLNVSPVFQGLQLVEQKRQFAERQFETQRQFDFTKETQLWREELSEREFLQRNLSVVSKGLKEGYDSLTGLNVNDPTQAAKHKQISEALNRNAEEAARIISDDTLSSRERQEALFTAQQNTQALFDGDYQSMLKNNQAQSQYMDGLVKKSLDTKSLIDYEKVGSTLEEISKFNSGQSSYGSVEEIVLSLGNPIIDSNEVASFEQQQLALTIPDDKTYEELKNLPGNSGIKLYAERLNGAPLDEALPLFVESLMSNKNWVKTQRLNGDYIDPQTGQVSRELVERAYRPILEQEYRNKGIDPLLGKGGITDLERIDLEIPNSRTGGTSAGTEKERRLTNTKSTLGQLGVSIPDDKLITNLTDSGLKLSPTEIGSIIDDYEALLDGGTEKETAIKEIMERTENLTSDGRGDRNLRTLLNSYDRVTPEQATALTRTPALGSIDGVSEDIGKNPIISKLPESDQKIAQQFLNNEPAQDAYFNEIWLPQVEAEALSLADEIGQDIAPEIKSKLSNDPESIKDIKLLYAVHHHGQPKTRELLKTGKADIKGNDKADEQLFVQWDRIDSIVEKNPDITISDLFAQLESDERGALSVNSGSSAIGKHQILFKGNRDSIVNFMNDINAANNADVNNDGLVDNEEFRSNSEGIPTEERTNYSKYKRK